MQNTINLAFGQAADLLALAEHNPENLIETKNETSTKWKSLHQKLLELYLEETRKQKQSHPTNTFYPSRLLDKLVKKDHLNCLVLNLFPDCEGYSLMLKGKNEADSETIRLSYEESELLEYIDNEQLPPVLIDLLEKSQANLFHSGCVIVEIRDYRRSNTNNYSTTYTLLQPTAQSLTCDINAITNDGHHWSQDDRSKLESQMLLATQGVCLDPSPAVFIIANGIQNQKKKFSTKGIKRCIKKYSQCAIHRKRKLMNCSAPQSLRLHDFVTSRKEKPRRMVPVNLKVGKSTVDLWKKRPVYLSIPKNVDVDKFAKVIPKKSSESLDNTLVIVEEHIMESDRGTGKIYYTHLIIQQRQSDDFYVGQLHVDGDYKMGSQGCSCRFPLATRQNVDKYISQFTEIFTEEGRRSVKITHKVPGKPPQVKYTQTSAPSTSTSTTLSSSQTLISSAATLATNITSDSQKDTQVNDKGSSAINLVTTKGRKKKPTELSLPILGASSQLTLTSPQLTPSHSPVQSVNPDFVSLQQQQQQQQALTRLHQFTQYTAAASLHQGPGPGPGGSSVTPSASPVTLTTPIVTQQQQTVEGASSESSVHQSVSGSQQQQNINISSVGSLPPPNLNLQNVTGLSTLTQGYQMSFTVPSGLTAIPVSMFSSSGQPTGIIVNSLPALPISTSTSAGDVFIPGSIVSRSPPGVSTTQTNQATVTSGILTTQGGSLGAPSGMLSLPISMSGGKIAQFIKAPSGLRSTGQTAPLQFIQIPGQQPLQLLSTGHLTGHQKVSPLNPQQQQQLKNATLSSADSASQQGSPSTIVSALSQLTGAVQSGRQSGQQTGQLGQAPAPGQTQVQAQAHSHSHTHTHTLSSPPPISMQIQQQQIQAQRAFQKQQYQIQNMNINQIQKGHQQPYPHHPVKLKSKKRTTPTPPTK